MPVLQFTCFAVSVNVFKIKLTTYFCFRCFSVDQTLISGAKGEDVVDACIQKINNAPEVSKVLNNNFGFFKRIALVESDFGKRENLLINKGGIWQVGLFANLNQNFALLFSHFQCCDIFRKKQLFVILINSLNSFFFH